MTFKWDFGDGELSEDPDPVHHYNEEGIYTVSLMAWSEHGCFDSIVKIDEVIVEPGCKLIFPNAFTPSDLQSGGMYDPEVPELTNDIFHPLFKNITDYHLEIYNRWGELLYISNQIDVGWDGFYNGKPAKQDVYIWKAWGRCINGKLIEQQGSVTLLR
jgi:gliding motility-associated-like protein